MGRTQASASRRMKLALLCCLLPCLVLSNPQITQNCAGSHCGQNNVGSPAGPIAQNCQGSACVQNNVGRRKREIVAEILAEAVEAVGRQERSAPPAGHGHDGGHQGHLPPGHVPNINIPDINIPDINIKSLHITKGQLILSISLRTVLVLNATRTTLLLLLLGSVEGSLGSSPQLLRTAWVVPATRTMFLGGRKGRFL